jgi:hypothetical protein
MYCGSRIEHTGISFANMNQYEEAAKAYVQALHLTPSAKYVQYSHSIALSTNCSHPPSSPIVLILPSPHLSYLLHLTLSQAYLGLSPRGLHKHGPPGLERVEQPGEHTDSR